MMNSLIENNLEKKREIEGVFFFFNTIDLRDMISDVTDLPKYLRDKREI